MWFTATSRGEKNRSNVKGVGENDFMVQVGDNVLRRKTRREGMMEEISRFKAVRSHKVREVTKRSFRSF